MGKYNGFDALKFGFFGQIGRNIGKDAYRSVLNSVNYEDTSSVDKSQLGAVDANGNFSYHTYKKTSVTEYIFWLIFIGIMPHLFTLIIGCKTCVRVFRRKVRFVIYCNCRVYKDNNHNDYIGERPVPFEFRKSFDEAEKGINIGDKKDNPVLGTRINTLMYVILTALGICWSYFIIAEIKSTNKEEEQNKKAVFEKMTQWNDSILYDDFTQSSTTIRYLFPETKDSVISDMLILVQVNNNLYFYTSSLCFSKAELKFNNAEIITINDFDTDILDKDSTFIVKPSGFEEMKFSYRYEIENEVSSKIENSSEFAIRLDGNVFRFKNK